jgi:N-methylhydantoinase B
MSGQAKPRCSTRPAISQLISVEPDLMPAPRSNAAIDPITFEVIRHKLEAITEEQAITLKNVSGSPVVTEATDFNVGIYLADGAIVNMGPQVIFHAGTMSTVIHSIIEHFSDNPGINEGDMFILNDPYRGAIHQPDVSIVMPIFHQGRRIAWTGSCAHELDTGGMTFGSWSFAATDVQQEAMLLPGVKIVEGGVLREDIWQMIMGMTRLPHVVGLDFKAMIAANNVAHRRFHQLMDRYGVETVDQVMRTEIDTSETLLRGRLKRIPDGIYRARDFLDHDGHANRLYQIEVAAIKKGETLTLDMEGSSPQAPGFINCTRSGLRGALFAGLLPILAPDIRWNEGVLKPVTIKVPEANICNARWPTPVSGATVSTAWVVQNVAVAALSRMVACVPDLVQEGQAVTKGQFSVLTMAGPDRDGGPFGMLLMDAMAGGGGAYVDHDGLDGSGDHSIPRPRVGNVEANEASGPFLYLFRSFIPDTEGAGTMRGGVTMGLAVTPHDADELHTMVVGHGVQVPNSVGQFGGMPGACAYHLLRRSNASIGELIEANTHMQDLFNAGGSVERLDSKPGHFPLHRGDVLAYSFQGGGGFGDPIRRDPARVARDVNNGLVTVSWASTLYGVVMRDGKVDVAATRDRRRAIRTERVGGNAPKAEPPETTGIAAVCPRIDGGNRFRCLCGADLGPASEDWKAHVEWRNLPPQACGPYLTLHAELELREFICRECGTLLEVEVARRGQASLQTIAIDSGVAPNGRE